MKHRSCDQRFRNGRRAAIEQLEPRMLLSASSAADTAEHSAARLWNEELLDAIRRDTPRPTVHSRNLFHTSAAMYDAWATYDPVAEPYLSQQRAVPRHDVAAQSEALSYAAYRVLSHRFAASPGAAESLASFDSLMVDLGYDPEFVSTQGKTPAAVGNRVAESILTYGRSDGANEENDYADTSGYAPVNPPLIVDSAEITIDDMNRWQPLEVDGNTQQFLTPHWDDVAPFAMSRTDPDQVYHDPGAPPQLGGAEDADFREAVVRVIEFSATLDPSLGTTIDVSPAVFGNNTLGTNDGSGHSINPATGEPYPPNLVDLGDWGRAIAEFWADGPNSETPPGHWNTLANGASDKMDELGIKKRIGGHGRPVDELEWDTKLYFALNGAIHDAAIAAWDAKEEYDYVRPISMIRSMGSLGQSSDPESISYDPNGLPLVPGLIEVVTAETTALNGKHEGLAGHEGEIAIFAWAGHPDDPQQQYGGCEWVLAENWLPYQAEDFVTPAFAGFVSGHSTFSRAAAEVLTQFSGDKYFPGGVGTATLTEGTSLKFEYGPSQAVELQWATYYDAADEAGLSRLYGGIHVDADDLDGRVVGSNIGIDAYQTASRYFHPHNVHRRGEHLVAPPAWQRVHNLEMTVQTGLSHVSAGMVEFEFAAQHDRPIGKWRSTPDAVQANLEGGLSPLQHVSNDTLFTQAEHEQTDWIEGDLQRNLQSMLGSAVAFGNLPHQTR